MRDRYDVIVVGPRGLHAERSARRQGNLRPAPRPGAASRSTRSGYHERRNAHALDAYNETVTLAADLSALT